MIMKGITGKLSIELYGCKSKTKGKCDKNNIEDCNNPDKLEEVISNHVKSRGFEDFVEIKNVETSSDKKMNCFAIISNVLFRDITIDEIIKVVNKELDKILYSALKNASKDLAVQQMSKF